MKKILLQLSTALSLVFIATTGALAQNNSFNPVVDDTFNTPYYIEMMQNPDINFFDVQRAFEKYWTNRDHNKAGSYKPFKRWEYYMQSRVNPDGTRLAAGHNMNEYLNYFGSWNPLPYSTMSLTGNWTELGPRPLPTNGTGQPNGLGRINAIAVHPTSANTIFVGAPAGGLWKTTNHGATWTSNTDNLPTLGVSSIVIDYTNPNTMWIGTGDRDGGDSKGVGVMKTTDGGSTWNTANTGMGNLTVGAMLQNPKAGSVLLAATSSGVYKSINGGSNWTKKSATFNAKDMYYKPGDTSVVYATGDGKFYRSSNAGETWTQITSGLPSAVRMVIGVTPANPSKVYLILTEQRIFKGCYMSTDNGLNFSLRSNSPNIMGYQSDGSDTTKGQAWYNLCLAVDTADEDVMYVGGVNIFKSIDGGQTWDINAHWVGNNAPDVHADNHCFTISKLNNRLYVGNDGGIYYTADGGSSWNDISSGLGIGQVYKIGQSKITKNLVINGYQDNGTALYNNGNWTTEIGGDGMECIVDYSNDNYIWGSLYYGDIRRSSNKGTSFGDFAANGKNGINEDGAWVTPYIQHATSNATMFIGYKNVWRTVNAKATTPTFTKISTGLAGSNSQNISVLEQSPKNTNILYMVRADSKLFRTDSCMAATPTWINLSTTLPVTATATDIEAHPTKDSVVYMTLSNKVYRSTNFGQSWTNISGTLPNVAMNCLVIDVKGNADALYVGSDLGVFYRDSSMGDWTAFRTGLPATAEVTELEIWYDNSNHLNSRIRAATYGRGLWESDLYTNPTSAPQIVFSASDSSVCVNNIITLSDASTNIPQSWKWTITPGTYNFISGSNDSVQNPQLRFTAAGNYTITLMATNSVGSNSQTANNLINVSALPNVVINSAKDTVCIGDSIQLNASGASSFQWSASSTLSSTSIANPYAKPVFTTAYNVTGTDANGCSNNASKTINLNQLPIVSVTPATPFILSGSSIQLTASGADTYQWAPPTGLSTTTGAVVTANPATTTTYTVTGTDSKNCKGNSNVQVKVAPVGIHELNTNSFTIYPNPVSGNELTIASTQEGSFTLEIYSVLGQRMSVHQITAQEQTINISRLGSGLYIVVIKDESGIQQTSTLSVSK
ncbi:MAG TPA: T9SS type A sorting domain-containing protein [Bacteroidia bacterium]|nr:T9SS type A sorting domain-containing protein [Bacteroidia bacterium]